MKNLEICLCIQRLDTLENSYLVSYLSMVLYLLSDTMLHCWHQAAVSQAKVIMLHDASLASNQIERYKKEKEFAERSSSSKSLHCPPATHVRVIY